MKRRTSSNSSPLAQSMVKTRHFWNVDFTVFFVSSLVTRTTWWAPRSIYDVSLSFPLNNKWRFLQMSRWINKKIYFLDALKNTIFPFTKKEFTWVLLWYHFSNKNTKKLENEKKYIVMLCDRYLFTLSDLFVKWLVLDLSSFLCQHQGHRRNPGKNTSEYQEQMLPSSEYQHVTDNYAVDDTTVIVFESMKLLYICKQFLFKKHFVFIHTYFHMYYLKFVTLTIISFNLN